MPDDRLAAKPHKTHYRTPADMNMTPPAHTCPDHCHRCPDGHLYTGCDGAAHAGPSHCTCTTTPATPPPPTPAPPRRGRPHTCPDRCHPCPLMGGDVYIGCIGVAAQGYARYCTCTPRLPDRYDPPETTTPPRLTWPTLPPKDTP